jgi:hypothetical protein
MCEVVREIRQEGRRQDWSRECDNTMRKQYYPEAALTYAESVGQIPAHGCYNLRSTEQKNFNAESVG